MKKELQKKITYWEGQLKKFTKTYIADMKRTSRDLVMMAQTRIQVYEELMQTIKD